MTPFKVLAISDDKEKIKEELAATIEPAQIYGIGETENIFLSQQAQSDVSDAYDMEGVKDTVRCKLLAKSWMSTKVPQADKLVDTIAKEAARFMTLEGLDENAAVNAAMKAHTEEINAEALRQRTVHELECVKNMIWLQLAERGDMNPFEKQADELVDFIANEAYRDMNQHEVSADLAVYVAVETHTRKIEAEALRQQDAVAEGWKDYETAVMDPQPKQNVDGSWLWSNFSWVSFGYRGLADRIRKSCSVPVPDGAEIRPARSGVWYWVWRKQPEKMNKEG